jgi:hypothetical protein
LEEEADSFIVPDDGLITCKSGERNSANGMKELGLEEARWGLTSLKTKQETIRAALRDVGDAGWFFPGLRQLVAASPGLFSGCPSGAGSALSRVRTGT